MKRGLTILMAALLASTLALPAMAQSPDSGSKQEAPAASAVTNPNPGVENAAQPSADDNSAKAGNEEMKPADKASADAAAQPPNSEDKSATNTTSDSGSNAAGSTAEGNQVE